MKTDDWVWGRELVIWGYDPGHKYTFKILEPRKGRDGCLSLQYHNEKSESWLVLRGTAWALLVMGGTVCTRLMREGDIQTIEAGVIHRLMAVTADLRVAEPSSPDRHAADKTAPKDVVRLHCIMGRPVVSPRDPREEAIVKKCIEYTEEAIACIEKGVEPPEYEVDLLKLHGAEALA